MSMPFTGTCGGNATVSGGITLWSVIALIAGPIGSGLGLFGGLKAIIGASGSVSAVNVVTSFLGYGSVSGAGAAAVVVVFLAALTTAVIIGAWLWANYSTLSATPSVGTQAKCISGVVNAASPLPEALNLFSLSHGFIHVVVKHIYWSFVTVNNPPFGWCASCENCSSTLWPGGTTAPPTAAP